MRTLAIIGAIAIAVSAAAPKAAWAWSTEQTAPAGTNGVDFSDPDKFQALQDKVNGKTTASDSGFHFSGGVSSGATGDLTGTNPYGVVPLTGRGSAFSYSPNPGFRGQPQ
ncbi:MAG: hypothetical protein ACLPPF_21855 [Rhodomicrobium sp.]